MLDLITQHTTQRNIGHSVFGMWRVKAAFKHAFHTLISPYTTNYAPTLLSRTARLPHHQPTSTLLRSVANSVCGGSA
jgi:hypothetical protein